MTPDDMAREMLAAGWIPMKHGFWCDPRSVTRLSRAEAHSAMRKELAQQREIGTVQTPVVGLEDARDD